MSRCYSSIAMMLYTLLMTMLVTTAVASPIPSNGVGGILGKRIQHTGRGTWFNVGHGNCGDWDVNSTPVIAIAKSRYDSNNGDNCGQWVQIVNTANGKVAYGVTKDSCQSCGWEDLDMSPSLFQQLAPLSTGQLTVSWHFMAKGWHL